MRTHELHGPGGEVYELTVPDDATADQIADAGRSAVHALTQLAAPGGYVGIDPSGAQPEAPMPTARMDAKPEPPAAAAPPAPTDPGTAGGEAMGQILRDKPAGARPFWTQLPSAIGATVGAGKLARAMPGSWPVKAAAGLVGAGLGGGGVETVQAMLEDKLGLTPSEPGKEPLERGKEAAVTSTLAQALGVVGGGTLRYLGGKVASGAGATGVLEDVIRQGMVIGKGGVTAIRAADGTMRSLTKVLDDPAFLQKLGGAHAQSMTTLARAWWQRASEAGPAALVDAWGALGKAGQSTLFGTLRAPVDAVVKTMAGKGSVTGSIGRAGIPAFMLPGSGKTAAAIATGADLTRNTIAPWLFGQAMTRGGPAVAMSRAVQAAPDVLPWLATGARGATQAGARALVGGSQGQEYRTRPRGARSGS